MVFQDPYASLNTRRTVGDILETVLAVNGMGDAAAGRARVRSALERVGLPAAALALSA